MAEKKIPSAFQEANRRAAAELEVLDRVVARHCKEQERAGDRKKAKKK